MIINPFIFVGTSVALITNVAKASPDGNAITSAAVDTTGANFIVVNVAYFNLAAGTLTDSKGNTWTALTEREVSNQRNRLHYCFNPTVGTGHTFSVAETSFASLQMQAWSGVASSPFDTQNGGTAAAALVISTGSVTPAQNNVLLIAGLTYAEATNSATIAIDNGFTITNTSLSSASNFGGSIAYKVLTNGAATNPQWTYSAINAAASASIASFKY